MTPIQPEYMFVLMQNDYPIAVYFDGELAERVAREKTGNKPTMQTGFFHVHKVPVSR